ncbi:MAG: DUF2600 family protein [Vulcanimicrobiaceae bacterium]
MSDLNLRDEIRWAAGHVLRSRVRRRALFAAGPRDAIALARFLCVVVPSARRSLRRIELRAERIPDGPLRREALSSVGSKAYHAAGACILATFLPRKARRHYIEIVTPLESIYDYLDNLCDRHEAVPVDAYPVLHRAIADALDPDAPLRPYYTLGPAGDDGGYLQGLVCETRDAIARFPEYRRLVPIFREAAELYAELQTFKHYPKDRREAACIAWWERHRDRFGDLTWWEFASAAGSQFQVYAPLYAAFCGDLPRIAATHDAYFPNVSALHVLLDYFIDQSEDREHDELNFIACYAGSDRFLARAGVLARRARARFAHLARPHVHEFVLRVMSLFYLTHPKVYEQGLDGEARALVEALARPGTAP